MPAIAMQDIFASVILRREPCGAKQRMGSLEG